jgi:hypothetical protein
MKPKTPREYLEDNFRRNLACDQNKQDMLSVIRWHSTIASKSRQWKTPIFAKKMV